MRRGFLIHPPHMIGGMALRLVQVNFKARDDSALGQFWAEALGWGVSSEGPGVTNLEPEGFAWPDPDAFYCPQGQESRAQTHGQSQSQSQSRHHGQDQKIPIRCQDRKGLRTWFPQLNDLPALAPAGHEAAAQR
jgi:hypothetical protein